MKVLVDTSNQEKALIHDCETSKLREGSFPALHRKYDGDDADDGVGRGDGRPRHGDLGPAAVLVQPLVLLQQHPPEEQLKGRPQHKARSGKVRINVS